MEKVFMKYKDGKKRCCWTNPKSQAYIEYHDKEWGMPVHDDHKQRHSYRTSLLGCEPRRFS